MNTPISDFVKEYTNSNNLRLHMPGHKGATFLGCEKYDITEIDGADVLYSAEGIIKESQDNATKLFCTYKTLYSTEGSSLAIRAMMYLTCVYAKSNNKKPVILAGRNAHKTFVTACALLDINVSWIFPDETIISCYFSAEHLDKKLSSFSEKPTAVYITSPDYLGNIADIKSISEVCKKHGVLLLVDNAHGAYLNFTDTPMHPIKLGADMCCDSAHKTLPVLTGGAYLHISNIAPEIFKSKVQEALALFASTSPSYLILQSLDNANKYISDNYSVKLNSFTSKINALKDKLISLSYSLIGNEPLKITIDTKKYGYTGLEFKDILLKNNIVCEFYDSDFVVMMFTPEIDEKNIDRLENVLLSIQKKEPIKETAPLINKPQSVIGLKEALFSESIELPIEECKGKILANPTVSCPPAIPIVVCGEIIDEDAINTFKYYGIKKCNVVK